MAIELKFELRVEWREDKKCLGWFDAQGTVRSCPARSAWNNPTRMNRPVGHGMIGRRLIPRGISRRKVRRVFQKGESLQSSKRRAYRRESGRILRDGSFEVALSQALRAGLRSDRPSGTWGKALSGQQIDPKEGDEFSSNLSNRARSRARF